MIETATWTPGPAVVLIVRESGQQSWLTLEEAIDQRDKLDAAIRSAGQANPPADNSAMVPCRAHDPVDAGCCCVEGWVCGVKPCMVARHQ